MHGSTITNNYSILKRPLTSAQDCPTFQRLIFRYVIYINIYYETPYRTKAAIEKSDRVFMVEGTFIIKGGIPEQRYPTKGFSSHYAIFQASTLHEIRNRWWEWILPELYCFLPISKKSVSMYKTLGVLDSVKQIIDWSVERRMYRQEFENLYIKILTKLTKNL